MLNGNLKLEKFLLFGFLLLLLNTVYLASTAAAHRLLHGERASPSRYRTALLLLFSDTLSETFSSVSLLGKISALLLIAGTAFGIAMSGPRTQAVSLDPALAHWDCLCWCRSHVVEPDPACQAATVVGQQNRRGAGHRHPNSGSCHVLSAWHKQFHRSHCESRASARKHERGRARTQRSVLSIFGRDKYRRQDSLKLLHDIRYVRALP